VQHGNPLVATCANDLGSLGRFVLAAPTAFLAVAVVGVANLRRRSSVCVRRRAPIRQGTHSPLDQKAIALSRQTRMAPHSKVTRCCMGRAGEGSELVRHFRTLARGSEFVADSALDSMAASVALPVGKHVSEHSGRALA